MKQYQMIAVLEEDDSTNLTRVVNSYANQNYRVISHQNGWIIMERDIPQNIVDWLNKHDFELTPDGTGWSAFIDGIHYGFTDAHNGKLTGHVLSDELRAELQALATTDTEATHDHR